jgi:hypothetical protein
VVSASAPQIGVSWLKRERLVGRLKTSRVGRMLPMQRGRKSSDSLSTSVVSIVPGERPPPPEDLTDEQAAIWQSTLARMPADWATPEIWPLLKQLCRHESVSAMLGRELVEIERGR